MRKYCHQTKRPSVSAVFVCIDFGRNDQWPKRLTPKIGRNDPPTKAETTHPQKMAGTTQAETTRPKRLRAETTRIRSISVQTKILTGSFILQSNRDRFNQNQIDPTCQLYAESEPLTRIQLKCRNQTETVRKAILDKLNALSTDIITVFLGAAKYTLVQLFVDCGAILQDCRDYIHTSDYNYFVNLHEVFNVYFFKHST